MDDNANYLPSSVDKDCKTTSTEQAILERETGEMVGKEFDSNKNMHISGKNSENVLAVLLKGKTDKSGSPSQLQKAKSGSTKVDFDQMNHEEQNEIMKKLKQLTVTNNRGKLRDFYRLNNNSFGKRKIQSQHRNQAQTQSLPNGRNGKNVLEFLVGAKAANGNEVNNNNNNNTMRSTASRRRRRRRDVSVDGFQKAADAKRSSPQKSETLVDWMDNTERNKYVAAMAREYEQKIAKAAGTSPTAPNAKNDWMSSVAAAGKSLSELSSPVATSTGGDVTPPPPSSSPPPADPTSARQTMRVSTSGGFDALKASTTWEGELPPREYNNPSFSRKIFVGGVPWDITEAALRVSFNEFGPCIVEWPGQEPRYTRAGNVSHKNGTAKTTGYVYMIFEDERAVASLLRECSQEVGGAGEWYFMIRAQRSKSTEIRQVQIIPWVTSDSEFVKDEKAVERGIEPKRTVFVGALHGMMTAQVLHSIMENVFGEVECVMLDTDKFKYPIGSGRVTFKTHQAYFSAIDVGFLEVHTSKFRKRVQIDPFLEESSCMSCNKEVARRFCRARTCFKYYCNLCWMADHAKGSVHQSHVPVIVPCSTTKATGVASASKLIPNSIGSSPSKSPTKRATRLDSSSPVAVSSSGCHFYNYAPAQQQSAMMPMQPLTTYSLPPPPPSMTNEVVKVVAMPSSSSSGSTSFQQQPDNAGSAVMFPFPPPPISYHQQHQQQQQSYLPASGAVGSTTSPVKSMRTYSGSSKSETGANPYYGYYYPPGYGPTNIAPGNYYNYYPYAPPGYVVDYSQWGASSSSPQYDTSTSTPPPPPPGMTSSANANELDPHANLYSQYGGYYPQHQMQYAPPTAYH